MAKLLTKEEQQRRLAVYNSTNSDQEAANQLQLRSVTFTGWRVRFGLPSKRVGRRALSHSQKHILEYFTIHPWSKLYAAARDLNLHSYSVMGRTDALEARGLLDVCLIKRVKHWAPAGTPLPKGACLFIRGAPSLYHTNLRGRIIDILKKEPWLPTRLIQKKVSFAGTAKSVETALLALHTNKKVKREMVNTPMRRMYFYASLYARPLDPARAKKVIDEMMKLTDFWKDQQKILDTLKTTPWQTAKSLTVNAGISPGYVFNALKSLEARVLVKKIRGTMNDGTRARYLWALADAPVSHNIIQFEVGRVEGGIRAQVVLVMEELHEGTVAEVFQACQARFHRGYSYEYVRNVLKDLEKLGVLTRPYARPGMKRRWRYIGGGNSVILRNAEVHKSIMESAARKLRQLGYEIEIRITPPDLRPQPSTREALP